jgi:GNAT superfamily N-acetyltransferase
MHIEPLGAERLGDLADLFESNATTRGCWCMWFLLPIREARAGWGSANRGRLEDLARHADVPLGLLAYADDKPVGWCAVGPRERYSSVTRSRLMTHRDPSEDAIVWFVPCFFVRTGSRRAGITEPLLLAAVEQARRHGAKAVEGFPLAGEGPHKSDRYLGTEPLFAACGFGVLGRPSPRRVVMRRELSA